MTLILFFRTSRRVVVSTDMVIPGIKTGEEKEGDTLFAGIKQEEFSE